MTTVAFNYLAAGDLSVEICSVCACHDRGVSCRPLERGWLRIRYDQQQILNFALSRDESNFQLPPHWPLLMYLLRSILCVRGMTVE